jgi:hypothetical protein
MIISLLVLIGSAGATRGEIKMVQMKIAGYLCGN